MNKQTIEIKTKLRQLFDPAKTSSKGHESVAPNDSLDTGSKRKPSHGHIRIDLAGTVAYNDHAAGDSTSSGNRVKAAWRGPQSMRPVRSSSIKANNFLSFRMASNDNQSRMMPTAKAYKEGDCHEATNDKLRHLRDKEMTSEDENNFASPVLGKHDPAIVKGDASPKRNASHVGTNLNNRWKSMRNKFSGGFDFGSASKTLEFRKVTPSRQTEIDKYLVRFPKMKRLILNSVAGLKKDFVLISKSDFSILTVEHTNDGRLKGLSSMIQKYFFKEVDLLQILCEEIDENWFDDGGLVSSISQANKIPVVEEAPTSPKRKMLRPKPSTETKARPKTQDTWALSIDTAAAPYFFITDSTWKSRNTERKMAFDTLYEKFYGSEFNTDIEKSAKTLRQEACRSASKRYQPPRATSKVDCKQSTKAKSRVYPHYKFRVTELAASTLLEKTTDYVFFSLNHVVVSYVLVHSAVFLRECHLTKESLKLLIMALNVGLLFNNSQLLSFTYKSLGDHYFGERCFEASQLAYTRALQHCLITDDRKMMIRLYDLIGNLW